MTLRNGSSSSRLPQFSTAISHFQARRLPEAIAVCQEIVRGQSGHVDAWQMMGLALCQLGQLAEGVKALEQSHAQAPGSPAIQNNLAEAYRQLGRLDEAEQILRRAVSTSPEFTEGVFNLANTLRDQGRADEAIRYYQLAVAQRPEYAKAHLNLANVLQAEGRLPRAAEHLKKYLLLQPPSLNVLLSLAGILSDLDQYQEAHRVLQQAIAIAPDDPETWKAIGQFAVAAGAVAEAKSSFGRLAAREPTSLLPQLRVANICPVIPPEVEQIFEIENRLISTIDDYRQRRLKVEIASLHLSGAEPPMAWAYYGLDNRPMKTAYAQLFNDAIVPQPLTRRTGKPHAGVIVTSGHEGVYAECLGRLVARLPNHDLDVTVVCSRSGVNILRHVLGETGLKHLAIPERVDEAADTLRKAQFDLLHYWEVGTGASNYFLPFFRPAPVQSTCWGWPVTSGQPHIDYYVSSELIESDDADQHYTERLVRLKTLPTWYAKPPVPTRLRTRAECGLPSSGAVYLCTQNLRKYHPDFDMLLAEILMQDPTGHVCVIEDSRRAVTELLKQRWTRRLPHVANRIVFLPRLPRTDYLHTVAQSDVWLDTLHYGGGANSLYDAFACGTPVVTLPGQFHRSRFALGAYRKMGILDLIAESPADYVTKSLRLARDVDYRRGLHERILAVSEVLFHDDSAVEAHRQFMLNTILASRQ